MAFTGWAQLHPELIEEIANHLTAYIDYIRFRAVCVSWRSALPKFPNHLPPQIPWALVPFFGIGNNSENLRCFFSFSENKYHLLELPECRGKEVCGSSHGWLLLVERGPALSLFNPLTRTLIPLPPISAFPHVEFRPLEVGREFSLYESTRELPIYLAPVDMQVEFIIKMVLSSIPSSSNNIEADDYMVVVILCYSEMAFMKKGDQVWTLVRGLYVGDLIFHKGQCFALDRKSRVVVCDFDGPSPKVTVISTGPQGAVGSTADYLVDFNGDLLFVSRIIENADNDADTILKFRVFKPDRSVQGWQWHQVKDLGDRVLFLDTNSAVSLPAHEFSGCQRNCIYFADNNQSSDDIKYDYSFSHNSKVVGGHDLGVFDLNDESIIANRCHLLSPEFIGPPPIWVIPNPS